MEPIFEVRQAEEGGGYVARALGQAIFTEAEIWQGLRENVMEVTSPHFEDAPGPLLTLFLKKAKDGATAQYSK
jgi:hypothetical protein